MKPLPRGARVAILKTDEGDRVLGIRAGIKGTIVEAGEYPTVEFDKPVRGEVRLCFSEDQLVREKYYKKAKRKGDK